MNKFFKEKDRKPLSDKERLKVTEQGEKEAMFKKIADAIGVPVETVRHALTSGFS